MELQNILDITCVYNTIIKNLSIEDINSLKQTNKDVHSILDNLGYLREINLEVDTFDKMIYSHNLYQKHKCYINWVTIKRDKDPLSRIPKLGNITLSLDNCSNIKWNHSIENITSLILIDCKNIDLAEFKKCKNLKTISIYSHTQETIHVSKITTFNKLETLIISGSIDLTMLRSNSLKNICICDLNKTKGYYFNHFPSLEFVFINISYIKCSIITGNHIHFIGIVYNNILYWKKFDDNFNVNNYLNLIHTFENNCNQKYYWQSNSVLKIKEIDEYTSLFYLDKF